MPCMDGMGMLLCSSWRVSFKDARDPPQKSFGDKRPKQSWVKQPLRLEAKRGSLKTIDGNTWDMDRYGWP